MRWVGWILAAGLIVEEDTLPAFQQLQIMAQSKATTREERIAEIDAQIADLQDRKLGYEAKALRFESTANRLQFNQEFVLETRRLWMLAEENRMMAAKMQEQIDQLNAEKRALVEQK